MQEMGDESQEVAALVAEIRILQSICFDIA